MFNFYKQKKVGYPTNPPEPPTTGSNIQHNVKIGDFTIRTPDASTTLLVSTSSPKQAVIFMSHPDLEVYHATRREYFKHHREWGYTKDSQEYRMYNRGRTNEQKKKK